MTIKYRQGFVMVVGAVAMCGGHWWYILLPPPCPFGACAAFAIFMVVDSVERKR